MQSFRLFLSSIRFRMALWFTLVLVLTLIIFSIFVFFREEQAVEAQAAARLDNRMHYVTDSFRRMGRGGDDGGPLVPYNSPSNPLGLQMGEEMVIADAQGKVTGTWGTVSSTNAAEIASTVVAGFKPQSLNSMQSVDFPYLLNGNQGSNPNFVQLISSFFLGNQSYLFQPLGVQINGQVVGWLILGIQIDPDGQLARLLVTLGFGTLLMGIIAMLGGYWLADRALAPVRTMARTAQEIADSDLDRSDLGHRIDVHTKDELGQLAGTFNGMLDHLQAAFQRQRQFTADASHELRTPLTIIGLEVERALSKSRAGEEKNSLNFRKALEVIRSENEFMTRLVSELLTLARMDAGQLHVHKEELDLSDVALEVVERYSSIASHKGLQLLTGDLPETPISADRQYLVQMIGNLVDNAIKYCPAGVGQWVKVETGLKMEHKAWVRVSDNGLGISSEHQKHLFDRFYRVDSARSHNPGSDDESALAEEIPGSGLGLSIVQRIAQMHGGAVLIQSEPGKGSTFEIELPLSPFQNEESLAMEQL